MKGVTKQAQHHVIHGRLKLTVDKTALDLAVVRRGGPLIPTLFLHGWGSTREDYIDIALKKSFTGWPFITYDAPGCGKTMCEDLSKPSIEFVVETAMAVLEHFKVEKLHLVGHSMGRLTALVLASRTPHAAASFLDTKGNLGPEDCFITRQLFEFPDQDPQRFLEDLIQRTLQSPFYGSGVYAAGLGDRVRPETIRRHRIGAVKKKRRWRVELVYTFLIHELV